MSPTLSRPIVLLVLGVLLVAGLVWSLVPRRDADVSAPASAPTAAGTIDEPELPPPHGAPAEPIDPNALPAPTAAPPAPVAMGGGKGPHRPVVVRVLDAGGWPVPGATVSAWTRDIEHPFADELRRGQAAYVARFCAVSAHPELETTWESFSYADPTWGRPAREGQTDRQGACTLALPSGIATLVASQPGETSGPWVADPWAQDAAVVLMLHPASRLDVQVIDAQERPVEQALVHVLVEQPWSSSTRRPRPARTDAEGHCSVELSAATSEYLVTVCAQRGDEWSGRHVAMMREPVEGPLIVRLGTPWAIEGTVVDAQGRPAAAAVVRGRGPSAELEATTSDTDGRFRLPVGTPGSWSLGATSGALLPDSLHSVLVEAAKPAPSVTLRLVEPGHIAGRVQWKDSSPAAGIRIHVVGSPFAPRDPLAPFGNWRATTTDADGLFAVGGLSAASEYTLYAYGRAEPIEGQARRKVRVGQDIELTVEHATRAGELVGTVVDRQTGEAVPEFAVRLSDSGDPLLLGSPPWRAIRDEGGTFRLAPGRMQDGFVWVSAAGYAPSRQGPLKFGADETAVQLTLDRLSTAR